MGLPGYDCKVTRTDWETVKGCDCLGIQWKGQTFAFPLGICRRPKMAVSIICIYWLPWVMKRGWHQGFVGGAGSSSKCAGCNLSTDQAQQHHLASLKWATVTVHTCENQAAVTIHTWGNQQLTQTSVLVFLRVSLFFSFWANVLCSQGWLWTWYAADDTFEILILLPLWSKW